MKGLDVACADTGGSCYGACNDGDGNGDFDGFMCLTGITAGMWAVKVGLRRRCAHWHVGGAGTAGSLPVPVSGHTPLSWGWSTVERTEG